MTRIICADCLFSKAIDSLAYCRKKGVMVRLCQDSCEMFKDGLIRYRKKGVNYETGSDTNQEWQIQGAMGQVDDL